MQPDFQEPIGIDLHESGIAAPSTTFSTAGSQSLRHQRADRCGTGFWSVASIF